MLKYFSWRTQRSLCMSYYAHHAASSLPCMPNLLLQAKQRAMVRKISIRLCKTRSNGRTFIISDRRESYFRTTKYWVTRDNLSFITKWYMWGDSRACNAQTQTSHQQIKVDPAVLMRSLNAIVARGGGVDNVYEFASRRVVPHFDYRRP